MGSIKEIIPECVTTDIFPNPWLDRQENAYRLSFADRQRLQPDPIRRLAPPALPGTALAEFRRVLAPGGRVIIVRPGHQPGPAGVIYGLFHHEPVGLGLRRSPGTAPPGSGREMPTISRRRAAATRIFWRGRTRAARGLGRARGDAPALLRIPGDRGILRAAARGARRFFGLWRHGPLSAPWPNLFAARLLVVLKRTL